MKPYLMKGMEQFTSLPTLKVIHCNKSLVHLIALLVVNQLQGNYETRKAKEFDE